MAIAILQTCSCQCCCTYTPYAGPGVRCWGLASFKAALAPTNCDSASSSSDEPGLFRPKIASPASPAMTQRARRKSSSALVSGPLAHAPLLSTQSPPQSAPKPGTNCELI